ncbi:MAG: PAS domain S-box protein [Mariprofundaceae bacterium]
MPVPPPEKIPNSQIQALPQALIDSIPDMVFHKDTQGVYIDCNKPFEKLASTSKKDIVGKTAAAFFTPDVAKALDVTERQVFDSGKADSNETWIDFPDGSRMLLDIRTTPYLAADGKLLGLIGVYRDITERHRVETLNNRTSEILEMIATGEPVSSIYDAIALMYEARNPGMRCSMLELKNKKLMHGGAPSLPKAYCAAVNGLKHGPDVGSCGASTYTGKRVLVENIATDPKWALLKDVAMPYGMRCCWSEPIKSPAGKVLGAFGMYYNHPCLPNESQEHDLESATQLAAIVMEREQRETLLGKLYRSFECAQDAIIISDLDSRMEYVNPAFERMTGYSTQEAAGKYTKILRSGKHPISFYVDMLETVRQGNVWRGEMTIRCKDGSLREVERNIAPVFDAAGNTLCQVNIQRDITEHRALEEQLQQAQKMDALGTLVGGIAHDFNNMLAGITANIFLLKERIESSSQTNKNISNIEKLSFRAAETIQQLLTFARKNQVKMEPVLLGTFIEETFGLLRAGLPENIDFHLQICSEALQINGDKSQLHQVLINLINNARDAVEKTPTPQITLKLEKFHNHANFLKTHPNLKDEVYAHLSVKDNGCGIAKRQSDHIFDPFFTTKEVGKGTGLGLAMVFGTVKKHKAFIEMESVESKGTTFHIYMPLHAQQEKTTMPPQQLLKGNGEKILLADDQAQIIESGKLVLESLGYQVLTATNGQQAVDIFKRGDHQIDLCIFDVVMPVMGGDKAAQYIREIKPNVKIIFSTGYDQHLLKDMTNETIINKPFSILEMSHLIREKLTA